MYIKRLDANTLDVFWGNGWYNWARFEVSGKNLKKIGGQHVPSQVVSALKTRFVPKDNV